MSHRYTEARAKGGTFAARRSSALRRIMQPRRARAATRPRSDLRAVPSVGAGISADRRWRTASYRLSRAHEQAELSGAIAGTRALLKGGGLGVTTTTAERVLLEPHRRGGRVVAVEHARIQCVAQCACTVDTRLA
jgi:hypothetical protein